MSQKSPLALMNGLFARTANSFLYGVRGQTARKAGLPPGSLVHVGEQKTARVQVRLLDYNARQFNEQTDVSPAECVSFRSTDTVTWIDVVGLHDPAVIEKLGGDFSLHPLTQEDILNTRQRPKVEQFDDYVYVVIKMLMLEPVRKTLVVEQVSLIIGAGYVISFQEQPGDVFENIRQRIRLDKGRVRRCGADYLAYLLLDAVVDNYFIVLEHLGEKTELLENQVLADPEGHIQHEIYLLKRELMTLRKAVWPLREMTAALQRTESELLTTETHVYLRDLYDHAVQVLDAVETLRDVMSGLMDIYLSSISNRMNAVMKVLTMIATVFIPLTFIAGVYGMNFEHMPELHWAWSYPVVMSLMLLMALGMLYVFRRKQWL
ncbi:MAG: magnesium/cobalt transporter CorA [Kiritimatiellia bacterium]|nr:magnesium/cobalt transporter CorA [Lentisphaerota bacterium]